MFLIQRLNRYLLWRSSVEPTPQHLAKYRLTMAVSLLPAFLVGLLVFGWYPAVTIVFSVGTAYAADYLAKRYLFKGPLGAASTGDALWLITGLLVAMLTPPATPWLAVIAVSAAAMILGKHLLSFEGAPFLPPVVVGLLAAHLLFIPYYHPHENGKPAWPVLTGAFRSSAEPTFEANVKHAVGEFLTADVRNSLEKEDYRKKLWGYAQPLLADGTPAQAVHSPRPIDVAAANPREALTVVGPEYYDAKSLLLGGVPASIGGSSSLALIFGILLVVFSGAVSWVLPVTALLTLGLLLSLCGNQNVEIHLLSGSTLLGFFYLAGDKLSAPRTLLGQAMAGLALGILEFALRTVTPLSEATFLTALVVQGLTPIFDQYLTKPKEPPRPVVV